MPRIHEKREAVEVKISRLERLSYVLIAIVPLSVMLGMIVLLLRQAA